MEIHQNPLFFHENIFFLIRKSPNTPNSIFRANIRNLLLREIQHITSLLQGIQPIAGNIKNKIKRDMIKIILQPIMEIN